jgi:pSer/pThr/pTyr-binding forkhead associated (FHA) protein
MGKLTIKSKGNRVDEVGLKLGDMIVGRSTACDIVLKDDKCISGKHAVIKTVGSKSTIEDLNSTNGTFIENARIVRHNLRHGDAVIIGEYTLIYRDVASADTPIFGSRTKGPGASSETTQENTKVITSHAQLVALDGKDNGKRIPLMKEETVLDNPGKSPARIHRSIYGYTLSAQVGPGEPRLNDKPIPPGGQLLENNDIIHVAGVRYQLQL